MPAFDQDYNDILRELPCRERNLITDTIIFVRAYLAKWPPLEEDEHVRDDVADNVADYVWRKFREGEELPDWKIENKAERCLTDYWRRYRRSQSLNTSRIDKEGEEGLLWLIEQRATKNTPHRSSEPERDAMMSEMLEKLWQELNDAERELLRLIAERKDYEQIAHHFGTTKHAIQQRVSRIKKAIKAKFDFLF